MEIIQKCTTLFKSLSSSAVTFATADNSISATGIGTAFPTTDTQIVITGAAEANNNTTFTVVSATANKIIVTETVTAESAGASVIANQYFVDDWKPISKFGYLAAVINASQNCTVYVEQSNDKTNVDKTTTCSILASTSYPIEIKTVSNYGRLKILNGGTSQTVFRAYINGTNR